MAKKILLVDDAAFMRKMLKDALSKNGYTDLYEAVDGADAVEKYDELKPDLVIMDITMPNMDGLTLIKSLREMPSYRTTPILMLTTGAADSMKQQGRAAGATGWLVKPFDPPKLLEVTKKVLN